MAKKKTPRTAAPRKKTVDAAPPADAKPKIKNPPFLFERSQAVVADVQKALNGPVIVLFGEVFAGIVSLTYQYLERMGKVDELYLVVLSNGGRGTSALRLVDLIRQYTKKLTVLAPRECASAATMIALGADEIQMGPLAYLTAVDTSLTHALSPLDSSNDKVSIELDELRRVVRLWQQSSTGTGDNPYRHLYQYIHPLVIGAVDRCSSLSEKICIEILSHHMTDISKAKEISHSLNMDYPAHGYPITAREATKIGLPVKRMEPSLATKLFELMTIYYEMSQSARTDFDRENYHNNQISNIIEGKDLQFVYQYDKDWFYRKEDKRWVSLNDDSSWHRFSLENGKLQRVKVHL
jgi:hypothetical protein